MKRFLHGIGLKRVVERRGTNPVEDTGDKTAGAGFVWRGREVLPTDSHAKVPE
ncbi:MAG: hypothetical protein FD150_1042 [Rhodobacteraceae bacterium]|nr:MAG: hypothetical protein FD150_1042 [Paracoccaceae bacterium]